MFKFKNLIVAIIVFCMILSIINTVFAATLTLDQIAEKVNSSNYGEFLMKDSYGFAEPMIMTIKAEVVENNIKASGTFSNESKSYTIDSEIQFTLSENILSITMNVLEGIEGNTANTLGLGNLPYMLLRNSLLMSVVDSVGQLNEYKQGDLIAALNQDAAKNYTLEKEGILLKQIDEDNIEVKIDLSKKIEVKIAESVTPNNSNTVQNTASNNTIILQSAQTNEDTTTAQKTLPDTGINSIIIVCIVIFFITLVRAFIGYKNY